MNPSHATTRRMLALALVAVLAIGLALVFADERSSAASDSSAASVCAQKHSGESCRPGNGKHVPGCAACVSHKGWPRITGVIWQVTENSRATHGFVGGDDNDELLGRHGSDGIVGGAGDDVIWGDAQHAGNGAHQHDLLIGGSGNDFIYSSHGTNTIYAGPGNDHIFLYYGRGTVDCGPGKDVVRTHRHQPFTFKHCEKIIR